MNPITLYEDDNFLIVNKSPGDIVHATLDKSRDNLYDRLKQSGKYDYLGLHHRLDKDTSGAILFTKNEAVNGFVQNAFENHTILKKYWAITHGEWISLPNEVITDYLKKEKDKNKIELMIKVTKGGQKAISLVNTLKKSKTHSLIEFTLKTGRMHQIRVQSALRNHPIIGDTFYGKSELDKKFNPQRLFLHSHEIAFEYLGKKISAIAPIDNKFLDLIEKIS